MNYPTALLLLGAIAGTASAGSYSTQVDFDVDGFTGGDITLERFDDLGGTRELTGVSFSYDQRYQFDMIIESNGYTPVSAGDWMLEAGYRGLHLLGPAGGGRGGDGGPGTPSVSTGGAFGDFTADLGASDGFNSTGPDTYFASIDTSFTFGDAFDASNSAGQNVLDTMSGGGTLETFMGGFPDFFFEWFVDPNWVVDPNNPPDGPFGMFEDPYYGIFVTPQSIRHSGTLTITYDYASVPAPSGLLVLGSAGLLVVRRRR